ncbi:GvpL/GvpF family gas vesicle protein [Rhodothermus profundi]|uniref:Gas vesicle synthesis protein GvpL/GvpF n=1 Tax=Rhodothermus profundi TaxID=633813 RepID=A0A1M6TT49_9BACT|nr:GvpL/GvpF family gas vesicle protein [Rhodothermus profundi]SHK60182.1 Gas vesicle synthesis protein GvpL/GvpF [Rhodothermus profundi]
MPVNNPDKPARRWFFSEEEIYQLTEASRQEALAQARTLLKQWWLEAILQQVTRHLAPPATQSEQEVYYVYGITWAGLSVKGPEPLETISFRNLQALVRRVPASEYSLDVIRQRLHDAAWLRAQLRAHHRLLASLQLEGPLLPLRFGTICPERQHVQALLSVNYEDFCATLALLHGRQEWVLWLDADRPRLQEAIALVHHLATDDPSLETETDRLLQMAAEHCHQTLAALADRSAVQHLDVHRHPVLRAAYLVATERSDAFRNQVASLKRAYQTLGIRLQLDGPTPPFNFARLHLEEASATVG